MHNDRKRDSRRFHQKYSQPSHHKQNEPEVDNRRLFVGNDGTPLIIYNLLLSYFCRKNESIFSYLKIVILLFLWDCSLLSVSANYKRSQLSR